MFFYLEWIDKRPTCSKLLEEKPSKLTFESVLPNDIKRLKESIEGFI